MHNLGVAVLLISYVLYVSSTPAKYTTRFDNLDIDQILKSDRLLKHYVECLMDRGPCTPEGSELRRYFPDALKTDCAKCSDTQKKKGNKTIKYLRENRPHIYAELEQKYDPEGVYRARDAKKKGGGVFS